jgi:hypothetical protein
LISLDERTTPAESSEQSVDLNDPPEEFDRAYACERGRDIDDV